MEVAVVGAGVHGLAAARALARSGAGVTIYEQFELDNTRGSSHGGSRIFRLSYPETDWVRLAQESYGGWRDLERETGEQLLELSGIIVTDAGSIIVPSTSPNRMLRPGNRK